jgi:cobalt-precorrin-5B (C1)-methyltransferase
MSELQDIPDRPLRKGYTTGACATACSKAAFLALLTQQKVREVEIMLPIGEKVNFNIISCQFNRQESSCTTQKDAGDDPDVTHGAIIGARVQLNNSGEISFLQGEGVGRVSLPGLEIGVGEPAINPVPRRMIENACKKLLSEHALEGHGLDITIFVEDGEALAKRTLNERLGIIGGISILGTTGIVTPFSASSYIASIRQGIDVAVANGADELVLNSGARSEKYLKVLFPQLPEFAFIHYGNWIEEAFQKIAESPVKKVAMGIMLGKAVKLAEGLLNTHSSKSSWNKDFIYQLAKTAGYSDAITAQILRLNMAGRLTELFSFTSTEKFYQHLLESCFKHLHQLAPDIDLKLFLINKEGAYIIYQP